MMYRQRFAFGLAAAIFSLSALAQSESYPNRPVKIVVSYPAGGYYDRVARTMADALRTQLKQTFIVENKAGANGVIAAGQIAKAPPDGYSLLLAAIGPNAISPALTPNLPYDAIKDFAPVSLLVSAPNVLVVPASSNIYSFSDLLASSKTKAGKLNYAHNGIGSSVHLAMELLKGATGTQMTGVPYKGSAPAVTAVLAGEVDVSFGSVLDVLPFVQSGKMRAIAIGGTERIAAIPDVKTIAELGISGFNSSAWSGLIAPAGTPASVIAKLNQAVNAALKDPAVAKQLSPGGELQILGGTSDYFAQYIRSEIVKWKKVVKDNAITSE